jgi:hypothetical protein
MYTIDTALWYPTEGITEADIPEAGLEFTVRDAVSSELAEYFHPYIVVQSGARPVRIHGHAGLLFQIRFASTDAALVTLPAPLEDVERALEQGAAHLLARVLGVEVTASVMIHYQLPPDEWDDALRDIA